MTDVAARAGVSTATVSRALSSPAAVRDGTRDLVLAAARDLGYRPNRSARGLARGSDRIFGLLVPDLRDAAWAALLRGAAERARAAGALLAIADRSLQPTGESEIAAHPTGEDEIAAHLAARTDGLALCASDLDEPTAAELAGQGPVVSVLRRIGALPAVLGNPRAGATRAAAHLRQLGHSSVLFAFCDDGRAGAERRTAVDSVRGVSTTRLTTHGSDLAEGYALAPEIRKAGTTAVVTFDGELALGIVAGLRALGSDVPGHISVVVAASEDPALTCHHPTLTTVAHPAAEMGWAAIELLVRSSTPGAPAPLRTVRFEPRLREAGSTGPVAGSPGG